MKYRELKVHATRQGIEAVTQLLLSMGIDQVAIDDPADLDEIMNKEHQYDWDYVDESLRQTPTESPHFRPTSKIRKRTGS